MSDFLKETKLGLLPIDWQVSTVDGFLIKKKGAMKIGPFGSSLKKDTMVDDGIKVYGQENIFEADMTFGDRFITQDHYETLKTCELFPGDFIISMMGTIGKCMVVPSNIRKGIMDSHLLRLQLDERVILTSFLSQLFSSPIVLHQVKKLAVGGIMAGLSSKIVERINFVLPPHDEQQKIAEILSTVDEKIEVIEAQIAETEQLKKGLMQRLLTKGIGHTKFKDSELGEIPEGWEVKKLTEVVSKVGSGITPKGGHEAYVSSGITFIRSQNVLVGKLDLSDVAFITQAQHEKMGNSKVFANDILLNITGASIGRCCVVPRIFKEANVNQHVCIIRVDEKIDSDFLSQFINSSIGQNQIDKFQAGGNREGLNYQQIRSFLVPLPPLEEQNKIKYLFSCIDGKLESLSIKVTEVKNLKKGLMQKLLTGKIRVKLSASELAEL